MKPILMKHSETLTESFKVWRNSNPYMHNPWHYHPEIEITLILKGGGTLFIGDRIINYEENDLFFIGPDLPHEFRSDREQGIDFFSDSIAVHFKKSFSGLNFEQLLEGEQIVKLFKQSVFGMKISGFATIDFVREKILYMIGKNGIERISLLLNILNAIASSGNPELLSSPGFISSLDIKENYKINVAYKFIIDNFKGHISLEQVAAKLHMTPSSFSRYFRKRTHKTFVEYLNEVRVGYSCKLLMENEYNVSEIAYESGFENISHFNKQFKKTTALTPREYIARQRSKNFRAGGAE